ncbi:hypothetical protein ACNKHL_03715 [Shigella flexneri]
MSAQQIEESRTRVIRIENLSARYAHQSHLKAKLEELWARALGDEREEIGRVITDLMRRCS